MPLGIIHLVGLQNFPEETNVSYYLIRTCTRFFSWASKWKLHYKKRLTTKIFSNYFPPCLDRVNVWLIVKSNSTFDGNFH